MKVEFISSVDIPEIDNQVRRKTIIFPDGYKIEKIIISKEK